MQVTRRLEWALFHTLRKTPPGVASGFGGSLAPLARRSMTGSDRNARTLFAALRPDWAGDPAALDAASKRLWASVARTYAEVPVMRRLVEEKRVAISNVEILDAALASGRPVILAFVHTGNWELSGMDLAFRFAPRRGFAIYDPPLEPGRADLVMQVRREMPADFIEMSPLVWRHALARLKQPGGGVLWIAVDENFQGRITAPAFGRPLRFDGNIGKIVRLAMRTGAIIVPFYGERHPGLRFTTHMLPSQSFQGSADDDATVYEAIRRLDALLGGAVIGLLDQWYYALMYRDYASLIPDDPSTRA